VKRGNQSPVFIALRKNKQGDELFLARGIVSSFPAQRAASANDTAASLDDNGAEEPPPLRLRLAHLFTTRIDHAARTFERAAARMIHPANSHQNDRIVAKYVFCGVKGQTPLKKPPQGRWVGARRMCCNKSHNHFAVIYRHIIRLKEYC